MLTKEDLYNMTLQSRVDLFEKLLRSTNREGIENVIMQLRSMDFYKCPASTKYHGNYEGGLLDHSLLVCSVAIGIYESMSKISAKKMETISRDNIIISALLHDVCKANYYQKGTKNVKIDGSWKLVETYEVDDQFPFGHGDKSVVLLSMWGLKMTTSEMLAIKWHMANFDLPYGQAQKTFLEAKMMCPLVSIILSADNLSSQVLEDTMEPNVIG